MDQVTPAQQRVLDVLDEEIATLRAKLAKIQPFIDQLNKLEQTKRTLLSERGVTGGGGNGKARLSQEQVIVYLKEHQPQTPAEMQEGLGVPGGTIRSMLARYRGETWDRDEEGAYSLIDS